MITKFKIFEMQLQYPLSRDGKFGGEGTHVIVLPSDKYLKKYWNKIAFVTITPNGRYNLHDMGSIGNSKIDRLSKPGMYCSIFYNGAIPGVHFNWINNSKIYNSVGELVGNLTSEDIERYTLEYSVKKYNL